MKLQSLECLYSRENIKIRQSAVLENVFYFYRGEEQFGMFKKIGDYWIWMYEVCARRYTTLSDLLKHAGELIDRKSL